MKKGVMFTMEDAKRYGVIEALQKGKMTNKEAAMVLNLSKRQVQRIKKKVKEKGIDVGINNSFLGIIRKNGKR